ncbi:MAG: C40 family peptidase [Christensenellales bacterium]
MFKIKTRTIVRDIKALDKAGDVSHRAKNAYVRTKEQAEQSQQHSHDNYVEYAEDKLNEGAKTATEKTGQAIQNQGKKTIRDIRERHSLRKKAERADAASDNAPGQASQSGKSAAPDARDAGRRQTYRRQPEQAARHKTTFASGQGDFGKRRFVQSRTKRTAHAGGKTVKETAKGTVKTANKAIKTVGHTAKTTIKTSQAAAKTAAKTAQAAAKTAQRAAQAARAAARLAIATAKVVIKTIIATVKAIIAAVKGLISLIAAGGWVAVVVILIICLVGLILGSAFGLFYSGSDNGSGMTMPQVVSEIDAGFKAGIDGKVAELSAGDYDAVNVSYRGEIDGDSMNVNNWNDVLSVYAVMLTTDADAGTDVVVLTPEKSEKLKTIFLDMNKVSYQTEVTTTEETIENEDGEVETVTKTTLNINITYKSLTYEQAADLYGFTDDQREILDEMMSPAYYSYYAALLGVDIYGGADLTEIISHLPVGTEGAEVVKVAVTQLGAPYVWGAKGPKSFDCSGFVYWSINQVDSDLGASMRTNAAGQAKWCYTHNMMVGRSELQPGDLVFWQNLSCEGCHRWNEVHHTGIYIGDGKVIEASSSKGRVVIRDLWESASYPIFMFGRPY